ncbi:MULTISPECIES: hypothetical protein [Lysinibacillus]|uniref:Translation initiation factor 2 n=1 Tax=Lysinibacillus antri TaxID=2498145 RepID=A0A3S0PME6_9BACI|nr:MULTISPECIES: hypothetical protein [Lysinibacillus]RUL48176.1 hypothetical protein EK386_17190 [Lysinibacillus antri]TSI10717.1 hypothetical protein FJQ64_03430 [Lysinibacillus sp. BW-2-10]
MQFQNRNINIRNVQPTTPRVDPPNRQNQNDKNENFTAKLGAFGGLISTIGGIISTYAAFLALDELQQDMEESDATSTGDENRIQELELQVQYLMKELQKLKNEKR